MKNVTITLEDDVARWARVRAAERDTSLSRWIGEKLAAEKRQEEQYEVAMASFLAVEPRPLKTRGGYPTRDELHDRSRLR